jgi:EAL domain-containing protein (putative c-di-GMP-specific phosphodiesterase class I)
LARNSLAVLAPQLQVKLKFTTAADEQLALLRLEGCTEIQGYLLSPPRPAKDVEAMLSIRRSRIVA